MELPAIAAQASHDSSKSAPVNPDTFTAIADEGSSSQHGSVPPSIAAHSSPSASKATTVVIISTVSFITAISTMLAGVLTIAIPAVARDVNLSQGLILWPASIYALVCGCTLLLSGSASDVLGARFMYLLGCFVQALFTLACGLSRTGTQIIVFRAISGLGQSFCLPSAVSLITHNIPSGKRRNIAFASMGGGQPLGFSLGLVLGGVFTDTIGWRWGFHMAAMLSIGVFAVALWGLPHDTPRASADAGAREASRWKSITSEIDWIGAIIASAALALLSYAFA